MFSGSDGETIRNPYYMTKSELFKKLKMVLMDCQIEKIFAKKIV